MRTLAASFLVVLAILLVAMAQTSEFRVPENLVAGQAFTIGGAGAGELYLIGPSQVIKRKADSQDVQIKAEELRCAGRWIAVLRDGSRSQSKVFWVSPAKPENLNFLARPSRVPVNRPGVITGVAFVFDAYQNIVLQPVPIKFSLAVEGSGPSQTVNSRDGVAWISSSSARKAGAAQFVAQVGDNPVRRVVQQVASDPCNLRIHVAGHSNDGVTVETDPVRDCTGNPVPDGTIVTFTQ